MVSPEVPRQYVYPTRTVIELAALRHVCAGVSLPDPTDLADAIAFAAMVYGVPLDKVDQRKAFTAWTVEHYSATHTPAAGVRNNHPAGASEGLCAQINLRAAEARELAVDGVPA